MPSSAARANVVASVLAAGAFALAFASAVAAEEAAAPERLPPGGHELALRWGPGQCEPLRAEGLEALGCTSGGDGEPLFVASAEPASPRLDLRGRFVRVWLRVADVRRLAELELRLSSDGFQEDFFAFPVPLFADPAFNVLQDGAWTALTFSFASARVHGAPDRARIDSIGWLLRDDGGGPAEIRFTELARVRAPARGAVSISFDDGYASQYRAAEIMRRRGFRGTAYVIPDHIGMPAFLSLAQLEALRDRHGWEIAGHHGTPLTAFTPEQLDAVLLGVRRFLVRHGFEAGAGHFAYPLGKIDEPTVLRLARKHFATARVAGSGLETLPPGDPHKLRVLNVLDSTPPEEIAELARAARDEGAWLILMFHHLRAPTRSELDYDPARFERLIELLHASGIVPEPVGEVWARGAR